MLSEAGRDRVEAAVRTAERDTAGEIVVVLARQAGRYDAVPLLYGLAAALAVPPLLIALTEFPAARIFALGAVVTLAIIVATWAAGLRAVPHALKRARARAAAAREFLSRGMADTRGRTGVLLFVAEGEHYAEVVGDVTIAGRVATDEWRAVVGPLLDGLGAGRREEALVAAVAGIGAILARHVPIGPDDADELPNRVVLL